MIKHITIIGDREIACRLAEVIRASGCCVDYFKLNELSLQINSDLVLVEAGDGIEEAKSLVQKIEERIPEHTIIGVHEIMLDLTDLFSSMKNLAILEVLGLVH